MQPTLVRGLIACLLPAFAASALAADAARPNIIYLMADDLGYADLGCYGQRKIQTPCIDRLATEGTRFTHVYAGAPVCAPSRCCLMTGMHTGHATVRGNKGENAPPHDGQAGRIPLRTNDVTVATLLKQAGYATGITGKWGLGEPGSTGLPNDHGFDEWLGYLNQDHAPDYYPTFLWRNREQRGLPGNLNGARREYSHDVMTEFAFDFIRRHKSEPFFLYVAWTIPHADLEVPSLDPYANETWPDNAKIFAAMITRMDRDVGRLSELLKELNLADHTLLFFTSDNGAPNRWDGQFDSCGSLRDKKGSVYEGGIRVPMIVRWPGRVAAGAVSDAPWAFWDVLPTLCEVAQTSPPPGIDGRTVLPTLLGQQQDLSDRWYYWESPGKRLEQSARRGGWKGVRHAPDKPLELYDLQSDPGEKTNAAAHHPDVVAELEQFFAGARVPSPYWPDR